jgi:hypothetical protein
VAEINFRVGWLAILIGLIVGTALGLFFHKDDWLGGYASWRRRMVRLGHISFFGTGFLNLAFVLSAEHLGLERLPWPPSIAFVVGAVSMPAVCFLAAWRRWFRHLFVIPVASLLYATVDFVLKECIR